MTGLLRLAALNVCRSLGVHEQCYDQTVETQHFGENENQDHADEETGLLSCATDTSITDDTDGKSVIGLVSADAIGDAERCRHHHAQ